MSWRRVYITTWVLAVSACVSEVIAAASELQAVFPPGAQRGTEVALTLAGKRLADAEEILFYRPGIQVKSIVAEEAKVTVTCSVDADCGLGELPLRVRTRSGVSELRTIYIGALPVVAESEPNNAFDNAQTVALDVTIHGVITSEDIDYFAVEAKAGERISAEIEALRLGRTMFDPYLAILDAERFELAASDDSVLLLQDSVASAVAPKDGRYVILVRDASFGGNNQSHYRLHVGKYPRPRVAYPPGARPGETLKVQFRGDVSGDFEKEIPLPSQASALWPVYIDDETGVTPSPVWLRVSDDPVFNENAPPAEPVKPPVAFQGVLAQPNEVDVWTFSTSKGHRFEIRVFGRELRSPVDSVLEIRNQDGAVVVANDDANEPDSKLTFTAPGDGVYQVRVRDHLGRGGPLFVYRIEIVPHAPSIRVSLERMEQRRPQFLQAIEVPIGNRFAGLLRVTREHIGGPAELSAGDLPAGVTISPTSLNHDESLLPLVFESAADAPASGRLCPFRAHIKQGEREATGAFEQKVPLVIAAPNEQVYYETTVDQLAVAVTESVPFRIEVDPLPTPLMRSGSAALQVRVVRDEGFEGDVITRMLWNPPGVSSAGSVTIPKDKNAAPYPINAAGNAPTKTHQLVVLAKAGVGGAERWVSSGLIPLVVADHYMTGGLKLCALQQGQSAGMVCDLNHVRPFEGEARLILHGLPHGVSAEPVIVKPGQKEAIFSLNATGEAPVGRRGGLFCEFNLPVNGVEATHRLAGGGVIRIDKPPAAVAEATPAAQPEPEKKPPPPRPLSRLQQLRKEAE